ncbi:MAG: AMP-binding protein [Acidobacteria bacterium]|nr:AMP-binding protein [Acidobacteriota bacterium]
MIAGATIGEALLAAAGSARGIEAIEHDGCASRIPYASLLADALGIAAALRTRGLATGDRVALVVPEVGDFVRAFFGIAAAGLLPVPLCPPAHAGDLPTWTRQSRHVLQASRASAVIASDGVAALLDVAGLDGRAILPAGTLRTHAPLAAPVRVDAAAPALLQFTSGSTAAPKGVVLTHASLGANIAAIAGPAGIAARADDIGVSWLPLYHDMGLIGMLLTAVHSRADIVLMSPVLFLKRPTAWLDAISHYRGTVSFAPNFAYDLCLRRVKPSQIDALDLSSWRVAGCGAEPVRTDTLRAFADRFARAGFRESSVMSSYGLAEHSLAVAFSGGGIREDVVDADRLVREARAVPATGASASVVRIAACGAAFPGHDLRIVDDRGQPLPERHVGAIAARGPSVMQGYFEDPIATAEALRDGWLYTGDLGYLADGRLFVCGRTKELIIRQGRKYHPPDLEAAIAELPGLRSSGILVFGISRLPDDDEVVALVEVRASVPPGQVVDQVRRRVRETAGLELNRVIVAPPGTIPRTTSGKVRRAEARDRVLAGTLER